MKFSIPCRFVHSEIVNPDTVMITSDVVSAGIYIWFSFNYLPHRVVNYYALVKQCCSKDKEYPLIVVMWCQQGKNFQIYYFICSLISLLLCMTVQWESKSLIRWTYLGVTQLRYLSVISSSSVSRIFIWMIFVKYPKNDKVN